jgi:hypothetical protein
LNYLLILKVCLYIHVWNRYINIPGQQSLCTTCNILEDEYHFFLYCHLNQQPRNLLINSIENKCPSFTNMVCLYIHVWNRWDRKVQPKNNVNTLFYVKCCIVCLFKFKPATKKFTSIINVLLLLICHPWIDLITYSIQLQIFYRLLVY